MGTEQVACQRQPPSHSSQRIEIGTTLRVIAALSAPRLSHSGLHRNRQNIRFVGIAHRTMLLRHCRIPKGWLTLLPFRITVSSVSLSAYSIVKEQRTFVQPRRGLASSQVSLLASVSASSNRLASFTRRLLNGTPMDKNANQSHPTSQEGRFYVVITKNRPDF